MLIIWIIVFILVILIIAYNNNPQSSTRALEGVPGHSYIISLKDSLSPQQKAMYKKKIVDKLDELGVPQSARDEYKNLDYTQKINMLTEAQAAMLKSTGVLNVEDDIIMKPYGAASVQELYNHLIVKPSNESSVDPNAGSGTLVYVIDTGVDPACMGDKLIESKEFGQSRAGTNPHGTHVASTIHVFAPGADIISLKTLHGSAGSGTNSDILSALNYAYGNTEVNDKYDRIFINMSLGSSNAVKSPTLSDNVNYAYKYKMVPFVAAGNDGLAAVGSPADASAAITVGSLQQPSSWASIPADYKWKKSSFSQYEKALSKPNMSAVGEDIIACTGQGKTEKMSGTSMATPLALGATANLLSAAGIKTTDMTPAKIESLRDAIISANDTNAIANKTESGQAILDTTSVIKLENTINEWAAGQGITPPPDTPPPDKECEEIITYNTYTIDI